MKRLLISLFAGAMLLAVPASAAFHGNPFGLLITQNGGAAFQSGAYTYNQTTNGYASGITQTTPQQALINQSLFPGFVNMSWNWVANGVPQIKTYNSIQYGNYNSTVPLAPITPSKVSGIVALTEFADANIGGTTTGFDAMTDIFLTDTAWNTSIGHHLYEIEVYRHTPGFAKSYADGNTQIGTFTASNGVAWKVSKDSSTAPIIIFYPSDQSDQLVGAIDLKAMMQYLVTRGTLTGNEYYNGHGFGVEVQQGAGYLSVRNYNVTYTPPASSNLLGVADLSDPSWTKTNVTVTNGGTSTQSILETATTANHNIALTIQKPPVATNYRLEYDITQSATSGLSRDYFLAQAADAGFAGAVYQGVKTSTTQGVFNSYGYGGYSINGTNSIGTPSAGVEHVTLDFQSNAQQSLIVVLNPESAQGTDSYAGSTASGARVANVTLTAR